eukprot:GHVS01094992.1.p1 GENE.GHVS01094992.1~~GHVS01094992.1.p1  ORF type:complete len:551 (-),score=67.02 GHVS01094992.1:358-2010(-)
MFAVVPSFSTASTYSQALETFKREWTRERPVLTWLPSNASEMLFSDFFHWSEWRVRHSVDDLSSAQCAALHNAMPYEWAWIDVENSAISVEGNTIMLTMGFMQNEQSAARTTMGLICSLTRPDVEAPPAAMTPVCAALPKEYTLGIDMKGLPFEPLLKVAPFMKHCINITQAVADCFVAFSEAVRNRRTVYVVDKKAFILLPEIIGNSKGNAVAYYAGKRATFYSRGEGKWSNSGEVIADPDVEIMDTTPAPSTTEITTATKLKEEQPFNQMREDALRRLTVCLNAAALMIEALVKSEHITVSNVETLDVKTGGKNGVIQFIAGMDELVALYILVEGKDGFRRIRNRSSIASGSAGSTMVVVLGGGWPACASSVTSAAFSSVTSTASSSVTSATAATAVDAAGSFFFLAPLCHCCSFTLDLGIGVVIASAVVASGAAGASFFLCLQAWDSFLFGACAPFACTTSSGPSCTATACCAARFRPSCRSFNTWPFDCMTALCSTAMSRLPPSSHNSDLVIIAVEGDLQRLFTKSSFNSTALSSSVVQTGVNSVG